MCKSHSIRFIARHLKKAGKRIHIRIIGIIVFVFTIRECFSQNLLNNPESVVFDVAHNRYLVSNWGDGTIVQIDSIGVQSYFSISLMDQFSLAGLYISSQSFFAFS